MSDGLRLPTRYYDTPAASPSKRTWVRVAVRAAVMVLVFAGAGIGGGYAWRHLWTPPAGEARRGTWVPTPVEEGLQNDFSGVGWYVVVCVVLGLLLGLVTALVLDRAELVGVAVALVGSALAAYVVLHTGQRLSPPDPDKVAAKVADGTPIPGDLEFDGWPPLVSCSLGTLAGLGGWYLVTPRMTRRRVESHVEHGTAG
jgi:disulfide bond formation protein DsbB